MKRTGSLYEQKFFTEALSRNLEVFTPLGDYLPQDCIVMNQAGKLFRMQIKGTKDKVYDKSNKGLGRYMITTATGRTNKCTIDCTKVDALAAYVEACDIWYIIPCLDIDSAVRISLYAHNPNSKAKHEKHKDNWEYFKQTH